MVTIFQIVHFNFFPADTSSTGEINGQESLAPVTKNRFTISSNEVLLQA